MWYFCRIGADGRGLGQVAIRLRTVNETYSTPKKFVGQTQKGPPRLALAHWDKANLYLMHSFTSYR